MEKKARQREHKKYKSDVIGPGSYEISPSKKVKKSKYQFFGSTEDRKLSWCFEDNFSTYIIYHSMLMFGHASIYVHNATCSRILYDELFLLWYLFC